MATAAQRARALEAAVGERPDRGHLEPAERARLVVRRLLPKVAELLEEQDPGPIPGPPGPVST